MNTVTLNTYGFILYTGFSKPNTVFVFVWLRPRNTWIPIQHVGLRGVQLALCELLPRRREHLQARALQIRAELSTHIHMETGPHDPHTVFGVFFWIWYEKKRTSFQVGYAHVRTSKLEVTKIVERRSACVVWVVWYERKSISFHVGLCVCVFPVWVPLRPPVGRFVWPSVWWSAFVRPLCVGRAAAACGGRFPFFILSATFILCISSTASAAVLSQIMHVNVRTSRL